MSSLYTMFNGTKFLWCGNVPFTSINSVCTALCEQGLTSDDILIQRQPDHLSVYVRESKWSLRFSSIVGTQSQKPNQ